MIFSLHRHQTVRAIYCHNDNLSHRKNEAEKLVLELLEIYGSIANVSLACGETPRVISRIFSTDSKPIVDDLYTRKLKDQDKRRILEFYKKEGISKPLPYEKYANQQFLSQYLKETYKEYVESTQDEVRTVSFSVFLYQNTDLAMSRWLVRLLTSCVPVINVTT